MVITSLPSLLMRASSLRARAGITALIGAGTGLDSFAVLTESRKPSAAARVMVLSSTVTRTPVRIGRASSWEAANTTCLIISLKSDTLISMPISRSGEGIGGNSWASMHLISVLREPLLIFNV